MEIKEIIRIIINNVPEIAVIFGTAPLQVFLVQKLKKQFPGIKKHKNGIFSATLISSGLITLSVTFPGWIPWKSIPIVFLAITVLSKVIYDLMKKIIKSKTGGDNEK